MSLLCRVLLVHFGHIENVNQVGFLIWSFSLENLLIFQISIAITPKLYQQLSKANQNFDFVCPSCHT